MNSLYAQFYGNEIFQGKESLTMHSLSTKYAKLAKCEAEWGKTWLVDTDVVLVEDNRHQDLKDMIIREQSSGWAHAHRFSVSPQRIHRWHGPAAIYDFGYPFISSRRLRISITMSPICSRAISALNRLLLLPCMMVPWLGNRCRTWALRISAIYTWG